MGDNDSGAESLSRGGEQGAAGTDRGERVKTQKAETLSFRDVSLSSSHLTVM